MKQYLAGDSRSQTRAAVAAAAVSCVALVVDIAIPSRTTLHAAEPIAAAVRIATGVLSLLAAATLIGVYRRALRSSTLWFGAVLAYVLTISVECGTMFGMCDPRMIPIVPILSAIAAAFTIVPITNPNPNLAGPFVTVTIGMYLALRRARSQQLSTSAIVGRVVLGAFALTIVSTLVTLALGHRPTPGNCVI